MGLAIFYYSIGGVIAALAVLMLTFSFIFLAISFAKKTVETNDILSFKYFALGLLFLLITALIPPFDTFYFMSLNELNKIEVTEKNSDVYNNLKNKIINNLRVSNDE